MNSKLRLKLSFAPLTRKGFWIQSMSWILFWMKGNTEQSLCKCVIIMYKSTYSNSSEWLASLTSNVCLTQLNSYQSKSEVLNIRHKTEDFFGNSVSYKNRMKTKIGIKTVTIKKGKPKINKLVHFCTSKKNYYSCQVILQDF